MEVRCGNGHTHTRICKTSAEAMCQHFKINTEVRCGNGHTHTQIYAETSAGKIREAFGYVMPNSVMRRGQQGTHHTTRWAVVWRRWPLWMGNLALFWEVWGRETRQRQGSEATQAQDYIPAQRPPLPHASSAPCRYPGSHDNSRVESFLPLTSSASRLDLAWLSPDQIIGNAPLLFPPDHAHGFDVA